MKHETNKRTRFQPAGFQSCRPNNTHEMADIWKIKNKNKSATNQQTGSQPPTVNELCFIHNDGGQPNTHKIERVYSACSHLHSFTSGEWRWLCKQCRARTNKAILPAGLHSRKTKSTRSKICLKSQNYRSLECGNQGFLYLQVFKHLSFLHHSGLS